MTLRYQPPPEPELPPLNHEQLRQRAVKWLVGTKHCTVVLSEIHSVAVQIPDAIGWQASRSILVECKVSRADFQCDKDKQHYRVGATPGQKRYYLTPPNLLHELDLPEGWGLLEASGERIKVVRDSSIFVRSDRAFDDEVAMLVSALRRIKQREFLVIVPDAGDFVDVAKDGKVTATVFVEEKR